MCSFWVEHLFKLVLWDIHASFCTLARHSVQATVVLRSAYEHFIFALAIQKPFRKLWQMHTHQLSSARSAFATSSLDSLETRSSTVLQAILRINRGRAHWTPLTLSTFWSCSSFPGDYSSHMQPVHFQGICHRVRCSHGHWEIDGWSGTSGAWIIFNGCHVASTFLHPLYITHQHLKTKIRMAQPFFQ